MEKKLIEAVRKLHSGEIGPKQFLLESEEKEMYLDWCRDFEMDPTDGNAEVFMRVTEHVGLMTPEDLEEMLEAFIGQ